MRAAYFQLIADHLYKLGPNEILRHCLFEHEQPIILSEAHTGIAGGKYAGKEMVRKILQAGLQWHIMHADARDYCRSCDVCQCTGNHPEEMRCYFPTNYTTSI